MSLVQTTNRGQDKKLVRPVATAAAAAAAAAATVDDKPWPGKQISHGWPVLTDQMLATAVQLTVWCG